MQLETRTTTLENQVSKVQTAIGVSLNPMLPIKDKSKVCYKCIDPETCASDGFCVFVYEHPDLYEHIKSTMQ